MSSILKVNQIQLPNGNTPTIGDLGLNNTHSVLQTLHTSTTNFTTATSTSFTDFGNMSLTITPSATNSLIFIQASLAASIQSTASQTDVHGRIRLLRDSSEIYVLDLRTYEFNGDSVYVNTGMPFIFIDQPQSTSAITYKFQGKEVSSGITSIDLNAELANRSTFIIQELAG